MLYGMDDERNDDLEFETEDRKNLRKKAIICGIIVFCCLIVMTVSVVVSIKNKSKTNQKASEAVSEVSQEEKETKVEKAKEEKTSIKKVSKVADAEVYEGEHNQIPMHDVSQIKTKFVPKQNDNAQEQITNIYYSDEKVAYLTFDDGPSKNITPQILDILKQENVPATFFVLGSRAELYPELIRREQEEGHYLANHGYTHQYSQIYRSPDTVFEEYAQTENAIRNALGNPDYNTYLFRFPGGSSGGRYAEIKSQAKELLHNYGISHTNWNCLTGDAEGKTTPEALMACLQETMQGDGSLIVLMHDASDKTYTAETLPTVISYLREQGYSFKNFYEIFK